MMSTVFTGVLESQDGYSHLLLLLAHCLHVWFATYRASLWFLFLLQHLVFVFFRNAVCFFFFSMFACGKLGLCFRNSNAKLPHFRLCSFHCGDGEHNLFLLLTTTEMMSTLQSGLFTVLQDGTVAVFCNESLNQRRIKQLSLSVSWAVTSRAVLTICERMISLCSEVMWHIFAEGLIIVA